MIFQGEHDYDAIIRREALEHAVPESLIKGVIAQESGFKPAAIRQEPAIRDASRGLMQLLSETAKAMGHGGDADGLFEPAANIHLGTKYLAYLRGRWGGTWADTVSAYNGGYRPGLGFGRVVTEDGVRCSGRTVPIGEYCNQTHVDRVMRFWTYFETGELPADAGALSLAGFGGLGLVLALGLAGAALIR